MKLNCKRLVMGKLPMAFCVKLDDGTGFIVWPGKIQPRGFEQPAIAVGVNAPTAWKNAFFGLMDTVQQNARDTLKVGDRLRVTKCPGTKRTIVFAGWDGEWIVSKSGGNDYSPWNVDQVNGKAVNFIFGQADQPKANS